MDPTERSVAEANVARFADTLFDETDPVTRERLQQLLINEENRFASRLWRLEMADRHIAEASTRIGNQIRRIAELQANGDDVNYLRRRLENSISVLEVFQAFRASLSDSLGRRMV